MWLINWFKKLFKKNNCTSVNKTEPEKNPIDEAIKNGSRPIEPIGNEKPIVVKKQIANFEFVDSSHYHPYVNPKEYKAPFLSHKCTQGTSFIDDKWARTKVICEENNIKISGYHFFECDKDPIAQVEHYMKTHGSFKCNPQVDYEETTGQMESDLIKGKPKLLIMLRELRKRTGMTPILYVNYGVACRIKFGEEFAEFFAWFARYNSILGPIPFPWIIETTAAWQFTESGKFPGFPGGNDVNIYFGKANVLNLE